MYKLVEPASVVETASFSVFFSFEKWCYFREWPPPTMTVLVTLPPQEVSIVESASFLSPLPGEDDADSTNRHLRQSEDPTLSSWC